MDEESNAFIGTRSQIELHKNFTQQDMGFIRRNTETMEQHMQLDVNS